MSLKDFIDEQINAIDHSTTLAELVQLMKSHAITDCPVINSDDVLLGIVYQKDLLRAVYKNTELKNASDADLVRLAAEYAEKTVADIMTSDIIFANESDSVFNVGSKMVRTSLSSLPVVKNGKFIGMVSQSKIFAEIMERASRQEGPEEQTENNAGGIDIDDALAAAKKAAGTAPAPAKPASDLSGPNKRFFKRVDMAIPVAYKATNLEGEREGRIAQTVNVSAGGMMILIKENLPANTMLEVALDIYQNQQPLRSTCRVVRCMPAGQPGHFNAGLLFLAMPVEERKKIIKYLDEKSQ